MFINIVFFLCWIPFEIIRGRGISPDLGLLVPP
jgi:hypothetical protein